MTALAGRVLRERSGVLLPLAVGQALYVTDVLVTGADARLEAVLGDGATLVLGAGSRCELQHLHLPTREAPGQGLFVISGGILRLLMTKGAWEGFEVRGTTAIASVRGTDFVVASTRATTAVFVVSGIVAVAGDAGGSSRLGPGAGIDIALGEAAGRSRRWPQERVVRTLAQVPLSR
ncbi:MAG: FecR domain-containing protein [Pseudomonadota bacterium]